MYKRNQTTVRLSQDPKWVSEAFYPKVGLKQGSVLSPILFSIYINDLVSELHKLGTGSYLDSARVPILLFADDIVLIADSQAELELQLQTLETWCNKWRCVVNTTKSNTMATSKDHDGPSKSLHLATTNQYKYLGVWFSGKMDSWDHHIDRRIQKASYKLNMLIQEGLTLEYTPTDVIAKCSKLSFTLPLNMGQQHSTWNKA